jgi:hypothetical protein
MTIDLRTSKQSPPPSTPPVREDMSPTAHRRMKSRSERALYWAIIAAGTLLVAGMLYAVASFGMRYVGLGGEEREAKSLVRSVSKHMLLPDEVPTIATVSDMDALKSEVFFQNAREGDKVLMFLNAQKAVLYRPSDDLIIEAGPITGE